jgi:hypothetical protein
MRNKREKLKTDISNLASAIAEGHRSAALLDQLGKRERELDDISEELLADGQWLLRAGEGMGCKASVELRRRLHQAAGKFGVIFIQRRSFASA